MNNKSIKREGNLIMMCPVCKSKEQHFYTLFSNGIEHIKCINCGNIRECHQLDFWKFDYFTETS